MPTLTLVIARRTLESGPYSLDFSEVYERLWDVAEDVGDGSRLYVSQGDVSLKWIIADLAGAPAEAGRTLPDNNAIRQQIHMLLVDEGWADRISERRFRLLLPPDRPSGRNPATDARASASEPVPAEDPADAGVRIEELPAERVTDASGAITLGGVDWSRWTALAVAAKSATQSAGVYLARVGEDVVYVGMAGERRGQGVRGRLTVYARGRGAVSGLGEAALDRALADPDWVAERLSQLIQEGPARAKDWAAAALDREPLEVAWTAAADAEAARAIERQVLIELADADLWNRARPR